MMLSDGAPPLKLAPLPTLASRAAEWGVLLSFVLALTAAALLLVRAYFDNGGWLPLSRRCVRCQRGSALLTLFARYYARRWVAPSGAVGERVQKWMQVRRRLERGADCCGVIALLLLPRSSRAADANAAVLAGSLPGERGRAAAPPGAAQPAGAITGAPPPPAAALLLRLAAPGACC
jgi:hypothetical protein